MGIGASRCDGMADVASSGNCAAVDGSSVSSETSVTMFDAAMEAAIGFDRNRLRYVSRDRSSCLNNGDWVELRFTELNRPACNRCMPAPNMVST